MTFFAVKVTANFQLHWLLKGSYRELCLGQLVWPRLLTTVGTGKRLEFKTPSLSPTRQKDKTHEIMSFPTIPMDLINAIIDQVMLLMPTDNELGLKTTSTSILSSCSLTSKTHIPHHLSCKSNLLCLLPPSSPIEPASWDPCEAPSPRRWRWGRFCRRDLVAHTSEDANKSDAGVPPESPFVWVGLQFR